ncbi:UV-stimulated scaffold protein A isoform X3 [Hemicordylus capensis]|uniref:UV-stimulated scaffold protein A isoform X3 n=1 Tax=Hemicordylus capensis TaxID=884348 RepID=UPI002304C835|nr:UV-stimulated scaffold protein A isoform X3 [Hemicordylus capensis]
MEMDQKLSQLVEDLTTSGEMQLNPRKMKELKKICKSSDEHINHVYHLLMTQLNEDHAEIRLSAFQIVDELFTRSHSFRTLIISNFQKLLELTVETDYEQPLPPPHEVAQKLKKAAIKSIQEWHEKYVDAYKKLSLGYHFLKQKVDFQDINARTLAERRRDEEKQKRLDNIYKDKAKKAEREMEDMKVYENEDNTAIISNVTDAYKLVRNKFLPSVQSWIQLFTRAGISDNRLRQAIDLKKKLETAMEKHKEMNIDYNEKRKVMKASDDEDDDFVEVPELEDHEHHIPEHLCKLYGLERVSPPKPLGVGRAGETAVANSQIQAKRNEEELDPTCAAATWRIIQDKLPRSKSPDTRNSSDSAASGEPSNKHDEEKAKAPLVPFGLDLFYWGQEQPTAGKILKFSSQHRFWAPNEMDEEVENKELAEMLKSRYITFAGKFEPVNHKCQAPMPHGGLCERQDRFKCPFHGRIIPRDESGNPVNQEDRDREAKEQFKKKEEQPEWQDPEFMREVEAATGVDLGSSRYSGKGKGAKNKQKKKKYPNLTDLKQQTNTSRSRIEKKVFNKTAMKRVVKAMNRVDQKKHEKFANQFNYALN